MKYRRRVFQSKPRHVGLPLAVLATVATLGMSGCSWDSALYDTYVDDTSEEIVACPPRIYVYDIDGNDHYLCKLDETDLKNCNPITQDEKKIYPILNNIGEYVYNGKVIYKYSTYQNLFNNNKNLELGYIDGLCTDRNDCKEKSVFPDAFKYNICPNNYQTCALSGDIFHCRKPVKQCTEKDTSSCENFITNWVSGKCENELCIVDQCEQGFKPATDKKTCVSACEKGQHYDNDAQSCVPDDIFNCGATDYVCKDNVAQWTDGSCINGICTVSACETGYKVTDNKCVSNCTVDEHYDSEQAKCVANDVDNCGATGHACKDEIKNSNTVSCSSGKCSVSACNEGYTVNNNTCVSSCNDTQYYDVTCKTSDTDNCGMKGYKCSEHISNWSSGTCNNNICSVQTCQEGYAVIHNECKANCDTTKYYDSSTGACATSDVANCGMKGYQCSTHISNWITGNCSNNVCVVTECGSGFKPSSDGKQCVSDCSVGQHYDNKQARCIADDVNNCGATGHACSDEIKNSKTVKCSAGKCSVSQCNDGYTVNNNTCVSSCNDTQYYDVTCKTSNLDNCGMKGYKCYAHISNWSTGSCNNNECFVQTCKEGYAVINNECKANCGSDQYYDNATASCKKSNEDNCGMSEYKCSDTAGWNGGSCWNNQCVATACITPGYHLNAGKCIADSNTECGTTLKNCSTQGKACINGNCELNTCPEDKTLCSTSSGKACIDIHASDTNNCGACGFVCNTYKPINTAVASCVDGTCKYQCTGDGFVNISNSDTASGIQCVNAKTDNYHCGATGPLDQGEICNVGTICSNGKCTTSCGAGTTLCGSTCVTQASDKPATLAHCGACNVTCSTSTEGLGGAAAVLSVSCETGSCKVENCKPGYSLNENTCEKTGCTSDNDCSLDHGKGICNSANTCDYLCDPGYTLNGNICEKTGCVNDAECPITFGSGTCSSSHTCNYSCDPGYTLNGSTCNKVGCLSDSDCTITNGTGTCNSANQCVYSCNAGYSIVTDSDHKTCEKTGCTEDTDCTIDNGTGTCNSANKCVYSCNTGYSLTGDDTKICIKTGCVEASECLEIANSVSTDCVSGICKVYACTPGSSPNTSKRECETCPTDHISTTGISCSACTGTKPHANDDHTACVECSENTHCTAGNGVAAVECQNNVCKVTSCDSGSMLSADGRSCVECSDNTISTGSTDTSCSACSEPTPYANTNHSACVECNTSSHCSSNANGYACLSNNTCGCNSSNDCPDTTICSNNICVEGECTENTHCSSNANGHICLNDRTCGCEGDFDCPEGSVCSPDDVCVPQE